MAINDLRGVKPNDFYTTNGSDVWRIQSVAMHPTATLVNVETGEKAYGGEGSLNLKPFKRLVLEQKP